MDPLEQQRLEHAVEATCEVREALERLPDPDAPTRPRPLTGAPPGPGENPCNAWRWRCAITLGVSGALAGKTVALKDAVAVAGVPMTAGSRLLEHHVPQRDATIVERILAAGGTIAGIATTEDMSFSGVSITSADGVVRNPYDERRSVGGSSSGVAALVALGQVDVGIGADQGGSIRLPASLCGVFGHKPTYGLVPYTGCVPIDPSIDHVGPIARSAADAALLLDVIAGDDHGRDPRQRHAPPIVDTTRELDRGVRNLRIAVVDEGFGGGVEERVEQAVREAAAGFAELGAEVGLISIPEHAWALPVHTAIILQGAAVHMLRGLSMGVIGKGWYDGDLAHALGAGLARRGAQLAPSVKIAALAGMRLWDSDGGRSYAKAQNLARVLAARYDDALEEWDLLLMPTTLVTAPRLPDPELPPLEAFLDGSDARLVANTCGFNQTGHPALSVPVGAADQLPVGLMLVGSMLADGVLLSAAHALETAGLTRPLGPSR